MVRPLAYITAVWCDAEIEGKEQALNYCRKSLHIANLVAKNTIYSKFSI